MSAVIGPCDFHFRDVVCGFFELSTENARRIVPARVEPVERCHGRAVLALLAFDFHGGCVGPYTEVVLAILVAPVLQTGQPIPHSAMYPFRLGTSTPQAREHGSEHYHLPHHERNVDVRFERRPDDTTASASDGEPILELTVAKGAGWIPSTAVRRHYQVLSTHECGTYVSRVVMSGELVEHEEEAGGIVLHPHEFTDVLDLDEVSRWPFREQWMRAGTETFHPVRQVDRADS